MASLSGSIERIVFRNTDSGFCVVRLRATQNGKTRARLTASITGIMPEVHPGLMLHLEGTWETHPVHGRTFKVETFEEEMPTDVDEVERYLGSGIVRGIGPVTASRIVSIFGARSIAVLDQEPEQLVQVPGLTAKRVQAIRQAWEEQNELRGLAIFLQSNGISVTFARRILEKYGETAQRQIEEDPYLLAHDIQ
ncbi:MAG: YrrC family ATP-dependent DNA helicase, partial [Chloroflexota bacterium]